MAIADQEGSRDSAGRSWKQGVKKRVMVSRLVYACVFGREGGGKIWV